MSATPQDPHRGPGSATPLRWAIVEWLEKRINVTELFSLLTHFGLVYTPVDTRRPLREVMREIGETPLVSYARWPHVLGLLAALLFGLEAFTGILLAFYYHPTAEAAYDSTAGIVRDVPAGWFIHQMHVWGAYLLVAVVLLRVARLFWDRLYHAPREVLWVSGMLLGFLVLQLDFTGRLLPWDVKSYWAAVRGLEVVWSLPVIGPILSFLVGGRIINDDVLLRFYVLHIVVLPALYLGAIWFTFATMRRIGLSQATERGVATTTFRKHIIDLVTITLALFTGLVTLATLVPFRFHGPADPYTTPAGTRPPWYMLAAYALLQNVPGPAFLVGTVLLVVALALVFLPMWSARHHEAVDDKRLRQVGIAFAALWLVLTVVGQLTGGHK
jgi:quinol-cytochrome oxidoreductase complex cytochrome b subunit